MKPIHYATAFAFFFAPAVLAEEAPHPVSVLAFDTKAAGVFGVAKNMPDLETAKKAAVDACHANGGEACIPALVYEKFGAMAELMVGRKRGNALGWSDAQTLQDALKIALSECDGPARNLGLTRTYKDDPETLAKLPNARCAIIYFDSSEWDEPVMQVRGQKVTGVPDYDRPDIADVE